MDRHAPEPRSAPRALPRVGRRAGPGLKTLATDSATPQREPLSTPPSQRFGPEVLATVAHELRTPLAAIQATLELLGDLPALPPDEAQRFVRRLQCGVAWLDSLVENLTIWTTVEMGRLPLNRHPVRLLDCVDMALALAQPLLDRKEQRVQTRCPASSPVVYGDARRLGQMLVNLLTNASAYGPPCDVITVEVRAAGGWAEVRVSDHGPGVPVEEQQRIFERYVRGRGAADHHDRGLGLGLHIVKLVAELHGGIVGVQSAPGSGASFWVRLPALPERAADPADERERQHESVVGG